MSFGDSTSTTNAPNAAGQTSQGSVVNLNSNTSKSNTSTTVNITSTDNGAVSDSLDALKEIASDTVGEAISAARSVADGGTKVAVTSLDNGLEGLQDSLDFTSRVLTGVERAFNKSIDANVTVTTESIKRAEQAAANAIASNEDISKRALDQARSVLDLTDSLNEKNLVAFKYGVDTFTRSATTLTSNVLESVADIEQARSVETQQSTKAIKELAEVVQTGGESIQANINKIVMIVSVLVVGVVAWRAVS